MDLTKAFDHSRGPLVIKESNGTGVPLSKFTAFFQLGESRLAHMRLLDTTSGPAHSRHEFITGPIFTLISSSTENNVTNWPNRPPFNQYVAV